jgi:hypothetical protein
MSRVAVQPIHVCVIKNENNLSQRDMMQYKIDKNETMNVFLHQGYLTSQRLLKEGLPNWLSDNYIIQRSGPSWDDKNNLVYEFYVIHEESY